MIALLWWTLVAQAGPGFEGVGDRGALPGQGGGPAQAVHDLLEREEEVLSLISSHDPALHARLLSLKAQDNRAYLVELYKASRRIEQVRSDPAARARWDQLRAIETQLRELASQASRASAEERERIVAQMRPLALDLFRLKQEDRLAQLELLRRRIAEVEAEIAERTANRERQVGAMVDELLAEAALRAAP